MLFAILKVPYSASIYIMPKKRQNAHFPFPQKLFLPIKTDTISVVTGRMIQRSIKLYPIASLPLVKNQNTIIASAQISR